MYYVYDPPGMATLLVVKHDLCKQRYTVSTLTHHLYVLFVIVYHAQTVFTYRKGVLRDVTSSWLYISVHRNKKLATP